MCKAGWLVAEVGELYSLINSLYAVCWVTTDYELFISDVTKRRNAAELQRMIKH